MPSTLRSATRPAAHPAVAPAVPVLPLPQYGTEHDAAALLGLSAETLRSWRCRRVGPTCWRRFGRSVRYDLGALAAWAAEQPGDGRRAA
jgi:hypothetical protein